MQSNYSMDYEVDSARPTDKLKKTRVKLKTVVKEEFYKMYWVPGKTVNEYWLTQVFMDKGSLNMLLLLLLNYYHHFKVIIHY